MDEYCNRACTCGKKRACVNRLPDSTSEEDEEDRSADTSRKRSRESHESHHLTAEEMMEENERQMKEFVQQKTKEELECLTLELLRRQPGAWADLQQQLPYPAPQPGPNPAPVLHGASVVSVRICPHRQRKNAALHVKVKDASLTKACSTTLSLTQMSWNWQCVGMQTHMLRNIRETTPVFVTLHIDSIFTGNMAGWVLGTAVLSLHVVFGRSEENFQVQITYMLAIGMEKYKTRANLLTDH
ncbi:uncharacterized protein [Ptychodera flava]|uniref:uncharacterized protein n=1 Tax=Ptychodera flava TaxID=63121 RepID=UPI00396A5941